MNESGTVAVCAMANGHSHAFQRRLRGAGERPTGAADSFWTWRRVMYRLAEELDPDSLHAAALEAFREMRGAGYGAVGEFHYVHHQPDGTPYEDPNAMAAALATAAADAAIRLVLLPAAYHRGGHARFRDLDVDTFLGRVAQLGGGHGVAAHSVRAVPREWLEAIAAFSDQHGIVRHVHAAEQPRELEECAAEHGCSPIELLDDTGFLGPLASVVHGIHVSESDIARLAGSGTTVVSCPTTEGNLGDGWPPALAYRDAGVPLAIGSDSQVRIDPFEEARELETCARREGLTRSALLPPTTGDLWTELARNGARALGLELDDLGTIEIDLDAPDLRGLDPADLPWALSTAASARVTKAPDASVTPQRRRE